MGLQDLHGHSPLRAKALKTSPPGSFPWKILEGTWHSDGGGTPEPTAILQCGAVLRATVSVLCGSHFPGVEKGLCEKSSLNRHHLELRAPVPMPGHLSPSLGTSQTSCSISQPPNPGAYDGQGLFHALVTNTLIRGWLRGPVNMSSLHNAG